jgi:asparagine synthase (glutamine-hydrolysing)
MTIRPYWRPSQECRRHTADKASVLEEFAARYEKAVRLRLSPDGNTGATLSAGLDSGSVCSLAARELDKSGRTLKAWTSVPYFPEEAYARLNWLTDEAELAANIAKSYPNIDQAFLKADGANPIRAVCRQEALTGRPQSTCSNYYWIEAVMAAATAQNCSSVLIGQYGNASVSWSPSDISIVPKHLYFPSVSWRKYMKYSELVVKKRFAAIKNELLQKMKKLDDKYPIVTPGFLHSGVLRRVGRDADWVRSNGTGQAALQELSLGIHDVLYHIGYYGGVEFRDPTMDIDLCRFLLTIPETMYFQDGMERCVLRLGMTGIFPDKNRLNRRRGQQGSDILPRLREHIDYAYKAEAYISQSSLARDVIELSYMRNILNRLKNGESNAALMLECTKYLLPAFSCGFFLANYDLKTRFEDY